MDKQEIKEFNEHLFEMDPDLGPIKYFTPNDLVMGKYAGKHLMNDINSDIGEMITNLQESANFTADYIGDLDDIYTELFDLCDVTKRNQLRNDYHHAFISEENYKNQLALLEHKTELTTRGPIHDYMDTLMELQGVANEFVNTLNSIIKLYKDKWTEGENK